VQHLEVIDSACGAETKTGRRRQDYEQSDSRFCQLDVSRKLARARLRLPDGLAFERDARGYGFCK
jgi:hypothetical protein